PPASINAIWPAGRWRWFMRLGIGSNAPTFAAQASGGRQIDLAILRGRTVLLKFYCSAACPVCDLHLKCFIKDYRALDALGLKTVVLFHSPATEIDASRRGPAPFDFIPDPDKRIFQAYGVDDPADFLIDAEGRIAFVHYGRHHADSLDAAELARIRL